MPLADAELLFVRGLLERVCCELGDAELRDLSQLGLRRRRVFLIREAGGAWLYDVMEGSRGLVSLGPEAVWATSDTTLDRWVAARSSRSCAAGRSSLRELAPALDLRLPDVVWARRDHGGRTVGARLAVTVASTQDAS